MRKAHLAVEILERRLALNSSLGVMPSSVYLNPTLLTFAPATSPVETTHDLVAIEQKYRLAAPATNPLEWENYYCNWGGLNEKWLRGGDGSWYFLLPQGDLYRWQRGSRPVQGTLIAQLGENQLGSAVLSQLRAVDDQHAFLSSSYNWLNWGGLDEKWIQMADKTWCYILPGGEVYRWSQGSYPVQGSLLASFPADGTYLPESKVYQYPTFLSDADNATPLETSADPQAIQQKYGFFSTGTYWQNWGGLNEKWLQGAGNTWFYVVPHGALYRWDGQASPLQGTLIALMDPSIYENPYVLLEPPAPLSKAPTTMSLVSDQNRTHLPDATTIGQSGGFSPNLRSLMRASDGSLWFTEDMAQSFWVNMGTRYYRQDPESGQWQLMGETQFLPGVRENGASLMKDDVIYTYVLISGSSVVQESYFSTTNTSVRGSRYLYTGSGTEPNANYLGAAVSPSGNRVVWWTEYPSDGPGVFVYLFDQGGGWQGPVVSTLGGNNRFAYAYPGFLSDTQLVLGGELYNYPSASAPAGSGGGFQAEIGELSLGQPLALVAGLYASSGANVSSVSDLWVDPATKDVHVLANTSSPIYGSDYTDTLQPRDLAYFYKPGNAGWSGHNTALYAFEDTFRGRFLVAPDALYLIRGATDGDGVTFFKVPRADIRGAIDWQATPEASIGDLPFGFVIANGIWVEDSSQQSEAVRGTDFLFTGNWPTQDNCVWDIRL